jgi:hypothetical protein
VIKKTKEVQKKMRNTEPYKSSVENDLNSSKAVGLGWTKILDKKWNLVLVILVK